MRFLFCKPFICFCKSSSHIYNPVPLKLEKSQHESSTAAVVSPSPSATDCIDQLCTETLEVKDEDEQKQQPQINSDELVEKSCLRKKTQLKETKKKVQWMDYSSEKKGLVEIREFERSEYEVMNNQGDGSHGCIIL